MSRSVRFIPIMLLVWLVATLAMRLLKPADPAIPSQLVQRSIPPFELVAAAPGKAGLRSADFATGTPRLLNIFASWCLPCAEEAPVLAELKRRGVKIDAIAVRDRPQSTLRFLSQYGDPYDRLGADPQSTTQIALGSAGVPETFVIDGHGIIRRQYIGPLADANIPGILKQLEQAR
jgi:cytochrome c biogenesis protein CcmG/thiol:disulfide interchange protein DsbE